MGGSASRPRPRAGEAQAAPPYQDFSGATPAFYLGPQYNGVYGPGYRNNGQFYGGYAGQSRPAPGPASPGAQRQYPGQNTIPGVPSGDKQLNQTATIRNAVNVKKSTIKLTPVAEDPTKLAISFRFDASLPCVVTTFVAATEDANDACKIVPSQQSAVAGVHYEKGLGLAFPKAGTDAATQAVVDLSLYEESELSAVQDGNRFPLIIRLETVTEKGLSEGHSLSELTPGGPQKVWVQSQTTFAQLAKDEEGKYQVRTLKQKIWVEGVSYELQEIYGMEQATAAAKDREGVASAARTAEQAEERLCVICLVNERDTTVLPCRHMCMCHECAQELRKQTSKCPICRNHVESLLHIRMTRQQAPKNPATPVDQSTIAAAIEKLGIKTEKTEGK